MEIHNKYFEDINKKYNQTYKTQSLDIYYKVLPKYVNFINIIKTNKNIKAEDLIKYILKYNINLNEYVDFTKYSYVPLYYLIYHIDNIELVKVMKYFIEIKKTILNYDLKIDNIGPEMAHFLISCNSKYIKYIYKDINIKEFNNIYIYMFINGLYDRYIILSKYIDFNNYKHLITSDIIYNMLISLLAQIQIICLSPDTTGRIDKLFKNYIEIFKLYNINPFLIIYNNENLFQICINWYLVPFVKYFNENKSQSIIPLLYYYKDFNNEVCAFFRHLFNDRNYAELCNILNKEIDIRAY